MSKEELETKRCEMKAQKEAVLSQKLGQLVQQWAGIIPRCAMAKIWEKWEDCKETSSSESPDERLSLVGSLQCPPTAGLDSLELEMLHQIEEDIMRQMETDLYAVKAQLLSYGQPDDQEISEHTLQNVSMP